MAAAAAAAAAGGEGPGSSSGRRRSGDEVPKWVVLRRKVELVGTDVLTGGDQALLDLEPPPTASLLAVNRAILPDGPSRIRSSAVIHSCDSGGLMLVVVTRGGAPTAKDLLVFDARDNSIEVLPNVPDSLLPLCPSSEQMALIARGAARGGGGGRDFVVAQLHLHATETAQKQLPRLLAFDSQSKDWSFRTISASLLEEDQVCEAAGIKPDVVVPHAKVLVFMDRKVGVLLIDLFTESAPAKFACIPPLTIGSAETGSSSVEEEAHSVCVTPCGEKIFLFRLDGLSDSESPTVQAWRLEEGDDGQACLWVSVYRITIDIWPILSRHNSNVNIGLADPLHASVICLFCGQLLVCVDLMQSIVVGSGNFFPSDNTVSYSASDVCAWIPPPLATQSSNAISLKKRMVRKLKKSLKQLAKYIKDHPDSLIMAGTAVQSYAEAYIPPRMKKTRTGAAYLGKALLGTGKAIKLKSSAKWLAEVQQIGCGDVLIVKSPAEAERAISSWMDCNAVGVKVQIADDLSDDAKTELRAIFVASQAEELLLCEESEGGWIVV